nr:transposase [Mangrovivirga cuniculi]
MFNRHRIYCKSFKLPDREFIPRFALHVLPKGFTRMRHYGILSSSLKKQCKQEIDQQIGAIVIQELQENTCHKICPVCKVGRLVTVAVFDGRGPLRHWKRLLLNH